jgi:uncharacterized spore protein YtfJ
MTTDQVNLEQAMREAIQAGSSPAFLERLAERIGGQARVQAVFGAPIERGELTVVPVARVRWGFGGGTGTASDGPGGQGSGSGSGGGGGAAADPVGYLEIGAGAATFRRISEPYPSPAFLLASAAAAAIVLRSLARLVRG